MVNIIPSSYLPVASQPWGREIQKRLENLESNFSLQKTNTNTVDSQLQSSYRRLDQTVRALETINVDISQITAVSNQAVEAARQSVIAANAATAAAEAAAAGLGLKADIASPVFTGTVTGVPTNGVATSSASTIGFLGVPQVLDPASPYVLTAADAGKHIYRTTTGGTINIPASTTTNFEIGTRIMFINGGAITTSITITTDVLRLAGTATVGTRTLGTNGVATAIKVTATSWVIFGNGLT